MTIAGNDEGNLTRSFAGLRVLDFSTTIAGPHCTRMLADMGAEVIKIETAEGDMMRTRPPLRSACSTTFGQLNVGKKSLVLDLKSPKGVEVVRRMVAGVDVLVENFRPGVMRRLKLDYASLGELNPKLIYCSISGYGQTGPSAELPAYAPVIHAASGYEMAHLAYQPGRSRPDYCGIYHADVLTGVYAFGAISAALYQRSVSGRGLMEGVEAWSCAVTTEKCLTALNEHGVPSSAYRTVSEALRDPQIAHRGALAEVEDGGGTFKVLNLPFRMSGATVAAGKRMSTLGEHTLAFLRETGLSEDEIAGFAGTPSMAARG
jgi:crotonobetainyl-CoA:carnitine CoA-transferase CaiB-like acyl-CoA transferase